MRTIIDDYQTDIPPPRWVSGAIILGFFVLWIVVGIGANLL